MYLSCTVQNRNSEFCAPLTSFDWNETDPNIVGTSSIDTTCTIWGLEVYTYTYTVIKIYMRSRNGHVKLSIPITYTCT